MSLAGDGQGADPPADRRADVRKLLDGYREGAGRVNGTLLKAAVEVRQAGDRAEILVHWSIDYDGPRPPLTILRPTLDVPVAGQCALVFFAIAADGKEHPVTFRPPAVLGPFAPEQAHFLTIRRGEIGRGTLTIPAERLRRAVLGAWPEPFAKNPPRDLYVQLRHGPTERGGHLNLDAWTGSLQTELLPVPLKGLAFD